MSQGPCPGDARIENEGAGGPALDGWGGRLIRL